MLAEGAPSRGNRALVFISSVNAEMASLGRIEYCASKAAAWSTGHSLAAP